MPVLTDDWPLTAINESALPAFVYIVTELGEPRWPGVLVRSLRGWVTILCAAQLCWIVAAFVPPWLPIARVAMGLDPPGRHRLKTPGVAHEIVRAFERRPGRVILAPAAHEATRRPTLNAAGLAGNQLPTLDVPTVSTMASGLTTDRLYPMTRILDGEVRAV